MNTIDASIPLQAGQGVQQAQPMDLGKMLSLAKVADAMQQRNSIKNVFAKPGNMDNGQLTQQGLAELFQVDPEKANEFETAQTLRQQREQQISDAQFKRQREYIDAISEEATPLWQKYDGLLKSGTNPEEAARIMQEDWTSARGRLKGLPKDVTDTIPERFDPAKLQQSITMHDKLRLADEARKGKKDERDEQRLDLAGRREDALERRVAASEANRPDPNAAGWDVMTDPSKKDGEGNPTPYRFNKRTGEAVTFDGQTYTPGAVAKVAPGGAKGGAFTPEMGNLMAALGEQGVSLPTGFRSKEQQMTLYQGLLERNQGKSPEEIAKMIKTGQIEFGAQKKETQTAAAVAGRVEVAQNEIDEFVPLVQKSALDVPRGKFVPLTKLMQMADQNISDPNLRALKININSLLNAYDMLASRGGTDVEKRKEVRSLLTSADSPEVLESALKQFQFEAAAAHRAAVKATKVPELEGPSKPGEGGKGKETGEAPAAYAAAADVVSAYKAGKISRDEAAKVLRDKGWAE